MVAVDPPLEQNVPLQQRETQHCPEHPLSKTKHILELAKLDYHPFQRGLAALTLTMPATKAPQLNAPMSFGIEINLR